jgi:hypothetical protein
MQFSSASNYTISLLARNIPISSVDYGLEDGGTDVWFPTGAKILFIHHSVQTD